MSNLKKMIHLNYLLDNYYWLKETETFDLSESLLEIKSTASSAIGEYEKVQNNA